MEYYSEKALNEIKRRKEYTELFIKAWQGVERKKTKEGKDFAIMKNNFKTAEGEQVVYDSRYDKGEQELRISIHGDLCGYETDEIDITPTVYHDSEAEQHYKETGQLVERGAYLHPYARLTPDEIEELINKRIEYWQGVLAEYNEALEHFEEYANKVVAMREEAKAFIDSLPARHEFRTIFERR